MDTAYSPRLREEELSTTANVVDALLAVERRSERMDTAYSPRLHEEEPSATANYIYLALRRLGTRRNREARKKLFNAKLAPFNRRLRRRLTFGILALGLLLFGLLALGL